MIQPDFEAARRYALQRLETELDPRLTYHTIAHTRDDVLPAAERLAAHEGITGADLLLLRTAALYHDIGFTVRREDHELASIHIAEQVLPGFGYAPAQLDEITTIILATRLPQSPRSQLARFLADADLDLLGRADFFEFNRALRAELAAFGRPMSDVEWYRNQLAFISRYHYWTNAARSLRGPGKAENTARLQQLLTAALAGEPDD
jgi:uncharacterized protein